MKIETTDTQFAALEGVIDATREGSTSCKVPKDALTALLRDHVTLLAAATGAVHRGGKGHKVAAGEDQSSLV